MAQCAVLAMLFELASSPKPGNVDRCHDFSDIGFHHFLTSAVSAYPVFRKAAMGRGSAGSLILEGVRAWEGWSLKSNTHFGSLVLLIPLALAAGRVAYGEEGRDETAQEVTESKERYTDSQERDKEGLAGMTIGREVKANDLEEELAGVLKRTTVQDAVDFYRAFQLAGARVEDVDQFSLKDPRMEDALLQSNKTLLDLMRLSKDHDIVAREWATYYKRSFRISGRLQDMVLARGLNEGVVRTFLEALADVPDSLIRAKFGREKAELVSSQAAGALLDPTLDKARQMDCELLKEDINPGSTADLIAASLFISLLRGLRF